MKNMKDIRKKADVKSAAIGKDRYKCQVFSTGWHFADAGGAGTETGEVCSDIPDWDSLVTSLQQSI